MRSLSYLLLLILLVLVVPVHTAAGVLSVNASNDGYISETTDAIFPTMRNDAGDGVTNNNANYVYAFVTGASSSGIFSTNFRGAYTFPTDALPDDAIISSVTIGIRATTPKNNSAGTVDLELIDFAPANSAVYAQGDYDATTFSRLANNISYASVGTSWVNFTLTNFTTISKTGNTSVMLTTSADFYNVNLSETWDGAQNTGFTLRSIGYSIKPQIIITYTIPTDTTIELNATTGIVPVAIAFNATGTAVDTFNWSFGDGTYSEDEDPTYTYQFPGEYLINLTATTDGVIEIINTSIRLSPSSGLPPMGTMSRAATYLNVSTYDGSGQIVHPSLVYNESGWNGYHWLLGFTPYPEGNATFENPSMRYSNDLGNWYQISGQPDPIIEKPASTYNNDPNIFLTDDGTLYLFWKQGHNCYNYTTTTDGVNWAPRNATNFKSFSGSFINNGTGWEAWGQNDDTHVLSHFFSPDAKTWVEDTSITTGNTLPAAYPDWHSEVRLNAGQYQLLQAPLHDQYLYFYNSSNGRNWLGSESNPVLTAGNSTDWDNALYKSSFIEYDNKYGVMYTGYALGDVFHVGLTGDFPDSHPPDSITSLTNKTPTCNRIDWQWTNPADSDYAYVGILINGTWGNVSNASASKSLTGLPNNTLIMFNSTTVDLSGNQNLTAWVNSSATTADFCSQGWTFPNIWDTHCPSGHWCLGPIIIRASHYLGAVV